MTFTADPPPTDFVFRLRREDHNQTLTSTVAAAPSFGITSPVADDNVARGQAFDLTWDPANAGGNLRVHVDDEVGKHCVETNNGDHDYNDPNGVLVADDGIHTVPAGAIQLHFAAANPQCTAEFILTRSRVGTYATELEPSGTITAEVERSVRFTSVP